MRNFCSCSLIVLFSILAAASADAQIQIVPKIGALYSTMASSDESSYSFEGGWGGQLGGDLRLGKKGMFQPGLYWQRHRVIFNSEGTSGNPDGFSEKLDFQKVHIPVIFVYKLDLTLVNLRAGLGASYSFLTFFEDKGVITKDLVSQNHFGLDAELGADILFISVDTHFSYGLKDFIPDFSPSKPWFISINIGITLM